MQNNQAKTDENPIEIREPGIENAPYTGTASFEVEGTHVRIEAVGGDRGREVLETIIERIQQ